MKIIVIIIISAGHQANDPKSLSAAEEHHG
jgi:hypothetical protein